MARRLTIRLQPLSGTVERFYAFVDCKKRTAADGVETVSWTGEVADDEVVLKIRVFGMGKAKYRVSIDLPGTADDQSLDLWLDQGYGELEMRI